MKPNTVDNKEWLERLAALMTEDAYQEFLKESELLLKAALGLMAVSGDSFITLGYHEGEGMSVNLGSTIDPKIVEAFLDEADQDGH